MYKYKYFSRCNSCVWLRRHPNVKKALITELRYFNPQSLIGETDFIRKYAMPVDRLSLYRHARKHVMKIEKVQEVTVINDKEPIRKVMGDLILDKPGFHETPLKTFIHQFNQKLENEELPITVKDGLAALRLAADIEKTKKDLKKDVVQIMAGAFKDR